MAKWFGKIGYVVTEKTAPGVWKEVATEREYYGDVIRTSFMNQQQSDGTNADLKINRQISIVADQFAYENIGRIRYAEFMGTNWEVTTAEPQYPRMILTLGGVYNGHTKKES